MRPAGHDPADSPLPNYRLGEQPLSFRVDNGAADGDMTALAIYVGPLIHHVRIPRNATREQVVKALRELAASIEAAESPKVIKKGGPHSHLAEKWRR